MNTNVIILSRNTEEEYLKDCDDTCSNSSNCICKKMFQTTLAGKALKEILLDCCLLCHRHDVTTRFFSGKVDCETKLNQYVNISSQYPFNYLIDCENNIPGVYKGVYGAFIIFNQNDYTKVSDNSIIQNIPHVTDSHWINGNFDIDNSNVKTTLSPVWQICYCENPKCKNTLLSCKNVRYGIGIENTFYNLHEDKIECKKCLHKVCFKDSNPQTGLILFENLYMSRCYFCHTLIDYKPNETLQCCQHCEDSQNVDLILNTRICARCKNIVTNNKRSGGLNMYKIVNSDNCKYYVYLCKNHRLKKNIKPMYKEEEFFQMIASG